MGADAVREPGFMAVRAFAPARSREVVVGSAASRRALEWRRLGFGMTGGILAAYRLSWQRSALVLAAPKKVGQAHQPRVRVGNLGARAALPVSVHATGGAETLTVVAAQSLQGKAQVDLLAENLGQVEATALVGSHDEVALFEFDVLLGQLGSVVG